MPTFSQHVLQAKHNFNVLAQLNKQVNNSIDWQVTVSFYTALHLINSYIVKEANLHYKTHSEVDNVINCRGLSPYKLGEDEYVSYEILKNLSRRSRYICHHEAENDNPNHAFLIDEKHLLKALKELDKLLLYFNSKYNLEIEPIKIFSKNISASDKFNFFITPAQIVL